MEPLAHTTVRILTMEARMTTTPSWHRGPSTCKTDAAPRQTIEQGRSSLVIRDRRQERPR